MRAQRIAGGVLLAVSMWAGAAGAAQFYDVANQTQRRVEMVSVGTNTLTGSLLVGDRPHGVAVTVSRSSTRRSSRR